MPENSEDSEGLRINIPEAVARTLTDNTHKYLASIFTTDPKTSKPIKRPGAPSIVVVLERSGAIAAAGITDFFGRHLIRDPQLIHLSHLGHELEELCGHIFYPELPDMTDQEFIDDFQRRFRDLASNDASPTSIQIRRLSQLIAQLSLGDHEIQVVDDFVDQGGVNEVIMPTVVELAGKQAGLSDGHMNITRPTADELVYRRLIEEEPHHNRFDRPSPPTSTDGKTITFSPEHSIAMLPSDPLWIDQVVEASFGPGLTIYQAGYLNESLRGESDFEASPDITPSEVAIGRGINTRGFNNQTDQLPFRANPYREVVQLLTERGLSKDEVDDYLSSLRNRLADQIIKLTTVDFK